MDLTETKTAEVHSCSFRKQWVEDKQSLKLWAISKSAHKETEM